MPLLDTKNSILITSDQGIPDFDWSASLMNSVYFDVNDIIADDQRTQRIKVKFLCSVPWKGFSTAESEEIVHENWIDMNSVIELPLWLASELLKTPFVERVLPRAFNTKIRSDISANATNVPLREISSHFYSLGSKMVPVFPEQRISDLLYTVQEQTFMGRLPLLTRPLQCTSDITGVSPLEAQTIDSLGICPPSKMETFEHHMYQMTCASRKQYDSWLRRDILRIRAEDPN